MKRRIISIILTIVLLVGMLPLSVMAQSETADLDTDQLQVRGTNMLGDMISDDISQYIQEEDAGNYNVKGLTVQSSTATVEYFAAGAATVIVGIYSEDGLQLLASGTAAVDPDHTQVNVTISGQMPQYFVATAYLVDDYDHSPLCTAYSTPMYTKEMQELLASTVDDYDADKVLNFDQDKTTNFAVYSDNTIVVKAKPDQNILESVDTETNEYLFRKADDTLLGLKRGAILAYEDEDGELLALRVYSITSDAQKSVLLKGFTPELEEVFSHVKIESSGDTDDFVVDESTGDPGFTYTGRASDADTASLLRGNAGIPMPAFEGNETGSLPLFFTLSFKIGNVSLSGSLLTSLEAELSYYISFKRQFISFTLDTDTTLSATMTGEAELLNAKLPALGFCPVPFVFIGVEPELTVKASAAVSANVHIDRTVGFSYEVGKGAKDLSTAPVVQTNLSFEGTLFVGVDFGPEISIMKDSVAEVKLAAPCGVTLSAKLTGTDHGDISEPEGDNVPPRVHRCKNCLDINVSGTMSLSLELEFLKANSLKFSALFAEKKINIEDFYYSLDNNDFAVGDCPYFAYRTTVSIQDEARNGIDKVQVTAKRTSDGELFQMGITNPEGVTTEYLTPGVYHFTGTANGVVYNLSTRIYTAGKVTLVPQPKTTQPTMPPYISSVVTTETIKDKTNSKVQETGNCGDNVTYTLYKNGLLEIQGSGAIAHDAFADDDRIVSVVIKKGVTSIGYNAFEGDYNLESVVIEEGLQYIGVSAFEDCEYLQRVQLPDSVTTIEGSAFSGCHSLSSIQLPSNLKRLGRRAFYACYDLTGVVIPDSVTEMTELEDGIFAECSSLVSAKLPKDMEELAPYLFYNCESLETVQIPAGVTTIGIYAFFGCENLQAVYFTGSQAQWDAIEIQDYNDPLKNATVYCNSQSSSEAAEVTLPDEDITITRPTYDAAYGGQYSTEETESYTLKNAKFTGLVPEAEYVVLSLAKLEVADLLAADNLLGIGQCTTDSSGTMSFQYVPRTETDEAYVVAFGASNRNLQKASIAFPELLASGELQSVNPTVVYDGAELVEGRDYEILGQVDYMKAGEYTCYIRGIHNYTGLVECMYTVAGAVHKFDIAFANMTLGNSLAMNFAFSQEHMDSWNGCYAKVVKTYADGRANKVVTIPYSQWGTAKIGGVQHFTLKFDGVAAKEMSDSVYVTVYDAAGNAISNVWEDSVRSYAMRTLNNPSSNLETQIMIVDLLNYGAAAQSNFGYNTADLANNQLSAAQKALATKTVKATDGRVKGENYKGTNLGLESQILMRYAFGGTTEDMYAIISFTSHTGKENNIRVEGSEFASDGVIVIDEIVIADGRKPVTITVYNADGSVYASATDSLESYIARMSDAGALYEMILKFSDSAYNFFH